MSVPRVPNHQSADLVRRQAEAINRTLKNTNGLSSSPTALLSDRDVDVTGNMNVSGSYKVASAQVVGARITGWTADTGTAEKGAHATYTAGATLTFSVGYVQAEHTAVGTRLAAVEAALQSVTRGQKAIKDAITTHGLIGT